MRVEYDWPLSSDQRARLQRIRRATTEPLVRTFTDRLLSDDATEHELRRWLKPWNLDPAAPRTHSPLVKGGAPSQLRRLIGRGYPYDKYLTHLADELDHADTKKPTLTAVIKRCRAEADALGLGPADDGPRVYMVRRKATGEPPKLPSRSTTAPATRAAADPLTYDSEGRPVGYDARMLDPDMWSAVPCPTCGAPAGATCAWCPSLPHLERVAAAYAEHSS